jgi:antitoxin ParD1/3/4
MNISLPPALRDWVNDQVETRGFGTASEFLRDLLRREKERSLRHKIDSVLLQAVETPVSPMTDQDWADIETEGRKLAKNRKRKKS